MDTHDQKLYREQPWDSLTEAILFIEDARKSGGNVAVHCAQGKSRSATVVVGACLRLTVLPRLVAL
jgi:protein-tyrosine phosphatase